MLRAPYKTQALAGRELVGTDDLPTLRAIYYRGDFRYQVRNRRWGGASGVKTCRRPDTLDWLEKQLWSGSTVIAEVPDYPPAP